MSDAVAQMFERLTRVFVLSTQLFNRVQSQSPIWMQIDELMNDIAKLNHGRHRMKVDNYVKRGEEIIASVGAIARAVLPDGEIDLERYLKFGSPNDIPGGSPSSDLKENVEIIPVKNGRGGSRPGAGRKSLGIKKSVSISLPAEKWNEIDRLIQMGIYPSYSEYFRSRP